MYELIEVREGVTRVLIGPDPDQEKLEHERDALQRAAIEAGIPLTELRFGVRPAPG